MRTKHQSPAELELSLARVEKELAILDRHDGQLLAAEDGIVADMKRLDHEYKDAHLHSIPKPIKHAGF